MNTSAVEVTNISRHGFWLWLDGRELFLPFAEFPWFREATIGQLTEVELVTPEHMFWPALDVDLTVDAIEHPDNYPLVSRSATPRSPRAGRARRRR